jgi:hypothetical protein
MKLLDFSIDVIVPAALDSASNCNEYQEFSWGKGPSGHKADNLITIYEPIV